MVTVTMYLGHLIPQSKRQRAPFTTAGPLDGYFPSRKHLPIGRKILSRSWSTVCGLGRSPQVYYGYDRVSVSWEDALHHEDLRAPPSVLVISEMNERPDFPPGETAICRGLSFVT